MLTIGTAALLIILFFTPQIIAAEEEGEDTPISTQIYGIAVINGTLSFV